jgi:hypothetical protein
MWTALYVIQILRPEVRNDIICNFDQCDIRKILYYAFETISNFRTNYLETHETKKYELLISGIPSERFDFMLAYILQIFKYYKNHLICNRLLEYYIINTMLFFKNGINITKPGTPLSGYRIISFQDNVNVEVSEICENMTVYHATRTLNNWEVFFRKQNQGEPSLILMV